jgi:D-alanyl-D-alanine carboxypeptidase
MKARFPLCLALLLAFVTFPAVAQISAVASPTGPVMAGPYLVVDAATGETLAQRDAGASWYPASLTKLMTMYVVFEELKAGRLQTGDPVTMSRQALGVEYAGHLGVPAGGTITVDTALTALVVRSLNDVAVALGEKVSGSEAAFAQRMNDTARRLGMTASHFVNAHGLPNPAQVTTARDMAVLGIALARDFPQYYGYFRADRLDAGARQISGGVKFVELYAPYADGLKTGFICSSGFNIVGSAVRDGRRLIAVAFGFRRADLRDEFLIRLFDEAFALKTAASRPKVWQMRNEPGTPAVVLPQGECGMIRYDMPGDAAWLGTYGDWRTARRAYDTGQADLASLGVTGLGKEYILPVTVNKVTRQAAVIADLEADAAQKLCAQYKAKKLFCEIKKPNDFTPPFAAFWR